MLPASKARILAHFYARAARSDFVSSPGFLPLSIARLKRA
jgi:hypothetical protein